MTTMRDLRDGAYVGELWRDLDPVMATFMQALGDLMPDAERNNILLPYIDRLTGTRSTPRVELRRAYLLADWAVRTVVPLAMERDGVDPQAIALLRALAPVVGRTTAAKSELVMLAAAQVARPAAGVASAATTAAWAATMVAGLAEKNTEQAAWFAVRTANWAAHVIDDGRPGVPWSDLAIPALLDRLLAVQKVVRPGLLLELRPGPHQAEVVAALRAAATSAND